MYEYLIKGYILDMLANKENVSTPEALPLHLMDRLFDKVKLFQHWSNGVSCS